MPVTNINDAVFAQLNRNHATSMDSVALITQKLVQRMKAERREEAVNFTRPDLYRANQEKAKLLDFKAKIADNVSAATKAQNAIGWVESTLTSMRNDVQELLGSSDATARAAAAAQFNTDLATINRKVDGARQRIGYQTVNLVGSPKAPDFEVDDLYSRTRKGGGSVRIEGAYLGARINIEDADGYVWRHDEGSDEYVQYNAADGARTGTTISADALSLESYDPDTGAVSFTGDTPLSGTVERGGIGLLKSEFYDDFADDAAVQRALDDIDAAIATVASKGSLIKANATLLDGSFDMIKERIEKLEGEAARITKEELDETAAKGRAAELKLQLAINNMNLITQQSTGLIENMISLTQGPGKAPGVFGMLGL